MQYFTQDYLDFFTELAFSNERKWFNENKKRFEASVKTPFEQFTADVVAGIKEFDKDVVVDPKKAVYRVYRDVRFSKDKTPYKTYMSFGFGRDRKDYGWPGYTLGIGMDNGLSFAGGMYAPDKEQLIAIRTQLMHDSSKLDKIVSSPTFKDNWGELGGEKNKILKPPFKEAAKDNPWLYNKQWVYWKNEDFDFILRDDLLEHVLAHYRAAYPVNQYFKQFEVQS